MSLKAQRTKAGVKIALQTARNTEYAAMQALASRHAAAENDIVWKPYPCSKCVEWLDDPTSTAFQKRARNGEFHPGCNDLILKMGGLMLRPRVAKKGR
jgi:hypothetical protein